MNKQKQKIIDYAKELYTSYDSEGNKVYSLREIANKLLQDGYTKVTHQTIKRWSVKYNWNKINEKIKQQSISKAKDEKFTSEEKIIEKESDLLATIYKYAETGMKLGYKEIFAMFEENQTPVTDIQIRDLMTLVKMNTEFIFRINDIPEATQRIVALTPDERKERIKQLEQLQRIK